MVPKLKLEIELVPQTSWYCNLRKVLTREEWDKIRKKSYTDTGYKCAICGASGRLNCHEVWIYNDTKRVQKLEDFTALCDLCHHVKHMGFAGILAGRGKLNIDKVIEHFLKVNNCEQETFKNHQKIAFHKWSKRSAHKWKIDWGQYKNLLRPKTENFIKQRAAWTKLIDSSKDPFYRCPKCGCIQSYPSLEKSKNVLTKDTTIDCVNDCGILTEKDIITSKDIENAEILAQKQLESEKLLLLSLVNPCVDWAKEHNLKKVTETDVDAFLLDRDIDLSPRIKRRSLRALINPYVDWVKERGLKKVTEADVNAFLSDRDIDLSPRTKKGSKKGSLHELINPCVNWAKEHNLKRVTEADVNAFLSDRDIDLSPRTKKRALHALVNSYASWAKEHGLKRVTEADVDAFLLERNIDHSPRTKKGSKKGSLHALVNPCVEWAKENDLKRVTEADVDAFLSERDIDLSPRTKRRALQALVNSRIKSK